jgi:dTDP-4-dehydrorhamnose reductase
VSGSGERRPSILLLGASGQLGKELARALAGVGDVRALARSELDLTDAPRIREEIRSLAPGAIVNAAAYTRVDDAESEPALAFAVNAAGPGILAEGASRSGALLVHYSTDFVFDGRSSRPYRESDPPNPLSVYGASKLAGEEAVAAVDGQHLIFRTAWLYGAEAGYVAVVRGAALRSGPMRFVDDQFGSPTWSRRVARTTATILAGLAIGDRFELPGEARGLYHLAGAGGASRLEFARAILETDPATQGRSVSEIEPVSSAAFVQAATRPAYGVLDCQALGDRFGVRLPPWRHDLARALGAPPGNEESTLP